MKYFEKGLVHLYWLRPLLPHCELGPINLLAYYEVWRDFSLVFSFYRDKKAIPPGIAPSTQVLDLRGNDIRVLHNNVFLQLGITNLQASSNLIF